MNRYAKYTDKELLPYLREGDRLAFAEIFDRYSRHVYFYVEDFVKDPALAEDIVQEIFIRLWDIRTQLHIEASFSAYLFRLSHNKAIDILRKMAVDKRLRANALRYLEGVEHQMPLPGELQRYDLLLDQALDKLPEQRRRVFILCRLNGRTYAQAAAELGVSVETIKEHMALALKSLRLFLADKGEITLMMIIAGRLFLKF